MLRAQGIKRCRKVVAEINGARPVKKLYGPNKFDAFVRDLRNTIIAMLQRLITFDERPFQKGGRDGSTFSRRVLELKRASLYIVDIQRNASIRT